MPLIRKPPDKVAARVEQDNPNAGLASASADERWSAARDAADRPDSVPILVATLSHESDPRVREAIFTALTRISTPESIAAVLPYIRSDDAGLRTGALDALRATPELAKPHLPQLLSDPDSDVRVLACELTRVVSGPEVQQLLCTLLETEREANVCAAAVEVLAETGDSQAIPSLKRCAARFPNDSFLAFAIETASDQISRQPIRG